MIPNYQNTANTNKSYQTNFYDEIGDNQREQQCQCQCQCLSQQTALVGNNYYIKIQLMHCMIDGKYCVYKQLGRQAYWAKYIALNIKDGKDYVIQFHKVYEAALSQTIAYNRNHKKKCNKVDLEQVINHRKWKILRQAEIYTKINSIHIGKCYAVYESKQYIAVVRECFGVGGDPGSGVKIDKRIEKGLIAHQDYWIILEHMFKGIQSVHQNTGLLVKKIDIENVYFKNGWFKLEKFDIFKEYEANYGNQGEQQLVLDREKYDEDDDLAPQLRLWNKTRSINDREGQTKATTNGKDENQINSYNRDNQQNSYKKQTHNHRNFSSSPDNSLQSQLDTSVDVWALALFYLKLITNIKFKHPPQKSISTITHPSLFTYDIQRNLLFSLSDQQKYLLKNGLKFDKNQRLTWRDLEGLFDKTNNKYKPSYKVNFNTNNFYKHKPQHEHQHQHQYQYQNHINRKQDLLQSGILYMNQNKLLTEQSQSQPQQQQQKYQYQQQQQNQQQNKNNQQFNQLKSENNDDNVKDIKIQLKKQLSMEFSNKSKKLVPYIFTFNKYSTKFQQQSISQIYQRIRTQEFNIRSLEPQDVSIYLQSKCDKTYQLYQNLQQNYFQTQKSAFILKHMIDPIQQYALLDLKKRKFVEFMYLISSRCFNSLSFIHIDLHKKLKQQQLNRQNRMMIDHYLDLVKQIYKESQQKFNKYSQLLSQIESQLINMAKDRWKIFKDSQAKQTKDRFLTGIENVDYTKQQQVKFTCDRYMSKIVTALGQHNRSLFSFNQFGNENERKNSIIERISELCENYGEIMLISQPGENNDRGFKRKTFVECALTLLKKIKQNKEVESKKIQGWGLARLGSNSIDGSAEKPKSNPIGLGRKNSQKMSSRSQMII